MARLLPAFQMALPARTPADVNRGLPPVACFWWIVFKVLFKG